MARPLRIEHSGTVYHVTSCGDARNKILSDDEDGEAILSPSIPAEPERYPLFQIVIINL